VLAHAIYKSVFDRARDVFKKIKSGGDGIFLISWLAVMGRACKTPYRLLSKATDFAGGFYPIPLLFLMI
jgi:hypothetical protein